MNRLWVRLSLAFIVVTQLSVFVVVVLADHSVNGEFRRYVFFSAANQTSAALVRYYNAAGSWSGVDKVLAVGEISQGGQGDPVNQLLRPVFGHSSATLPNVLPDVLHNAPSNVLPNSLPKTLICPPPSPLMLAD